MPGDSSRIQTGVDRLLRHVREKNEVSLEEAAKSMGVDKNVALGWASALEDSGLIDVHHSARRGRVLKSRDVGDSEAGVEKARKEAAESVKESRILREERAEIEQFRDILERMERSLDDDMEESEELEDVFTGENLEILRDHIQALKEAEEGVEEVDEHLDDIISRLDVLSMLEGEIEEEDGGEGLLDRIRGLLPGRRKRKTFKCGQCGKEFDTQHGLKVHIGMEHDE